MRVLIASTYVPFCKGGGIKIAEDLNRELRRRGYESDLTLLPFQDDWSRYPDQVAGLRLLDLTESCGNRIDRLVTIRTPAHVLRHPNKVAWFIHHFRAAYDLADHPKWGMPKSPRGEHYRNVFRRLDDACLRECRAVYTNSGVVADRLRRYNHLEPTGVLFPPLHTDHGFHPGPFGDYVFYPSRVNAIKRQELAVRAVRHTRYPVRLVIGGTGDTPADLDKMRELADAEGVSRRVEFTGWLAEERKAELMAGCCAALYLAYDEDSYGYVTLEAFHAQKPVITLTDSGGPLEVIRDGENGLVCEPTPEALGAAMDRLWADRRLARRLGAEAGDVPRRHRISWDHVIERLTA